MNKVKESYFNLIKKKVKRRRRRIREGKVNIYNCKSIFLCSLSVEKKNDSLLLTSLIYYYSPFDIFILNCNKEFFFIMCVLKII